MKSGVDLKTRFAHALALACLSWVLIDATNGQILGTFGTYAECAGAAPRDRAWTCVQR